MCFSNKNFHFVFERIFKKLIVHFDPLILEIFYLTLVKTSVLSTGYSFFLEKSQISFILSLTFSTSNGILKKAPSLL